MAGGPAAAAAAECAIDDFNVVLVRTVLVCPRTVDAVVPIKHARIHLVYLLAAQPSADFFQSLLVQFLVLAHGFSSCFKVFSSSRFSASRTIRNIRDLDVFRHSVQLIIERLEGKCKRFVGLRRIRTAIRLNL